MSARITDVSTNFQPISGHKLAKEGAGNSSRKYVNESRRTCRVAGNETTRSRLLVYQERPDDCQRKYVSLLRIRFDGLSSAKLY